eukprot:CAMPEP_0185251098 /NCGR_PEP_ID=MMETSP1359-20130426/445_1 /TAXON_ID=552665 /ORGANISM="Bigelowiella longifila, Strain CCMP242" /LENGTH=179 /DNA_ID=CAMNT_0027832833 /DNA_START=80 /DNA_END=619 /DNA_ORIENTATION=-
MVNTQIFREENVELPPSDFQKGIKEKVKKRLKEKVEGKCSARYGFTIMVAAIVNQDKLEGRLDEITGCAHFKVKYRAIVFRPYPNEILMAEVNNITDQGMFCRAGPLELFVSKYHIPSPYKFNPVDKQYTCQRDDQEVEIIKKGSHCRLRILNWTIDRNKATGVATVKGPYLGFDQSLE